MPRTIEGIVASHQAATERRKAGKPIWDHKLHIKHLLSNDGSDETAQETGRQIAQVLLASSWLKADEKENGERMGGGEVAQVADEIKDVDDLEHLNAVLDALYGLADADRVWID